MAYNVLLQQVATHSYVITTVVKLNTVVSEIPYVF
jgi:hypothetical protein